MKCAVLKRRFSLLPTGSRFGEAYKSTENQLLELRRFAQAHDYTVYKEDVEHESGGTGKRSEFQALFTDAHLRRFDLVLFWSLDCFSREGALPTLQHLNQLQGWGVRYKSLTEQYLDSIGLFQEAIVSLLATLANQERCSHRADTRTEKAWVIEIMRLARCCA
ncbi:MAG: recombinase family protein [Hymenobacter sp.]|nr:MAG: recombinase family protein [Hymenobacter sp.]